MTDISEDDLNAMTDEVEIEEWVHATAEKHGINLEKNGDQYRLDIDLWFPLQMVEAFLRGAEGMRPRPEPVGDP